VCSITDALSIVGDRYALLVAREMRYGHTRFQEIAASTGAPRDVLTARLRKLEQAGVIQRELGGTDARSRVRQGPAAH
jgi:DNA-binding HxlR family transcriptional regulator